MVLDRAGKFKVDVRRLATHHHRVEHDPAYAWLMRDLNFHEAVEAFSRFALRRARTVDGRFASRFAEYRFSQYKFLELVLPRVYRFLLRHEYRRHPQPVARAVLTKALKQIHGLQKSIGSGAKLEVPQDQERLTKLLEDLAYRCKFWSTPRRLPRNDATWPKREFLATVARDLRESFGERIPIRVYAALAAGISYDIDRKELRHQIAASRSR